MKRGKDPIQVLLIEPNAVVTDFQATHLLRPVGVRTPAIFEVSPHNYPRPDAGSLKLKGVGNQVLQEMA